MKIKANGITINYQIDGPDGASGSNAPWLVFSNSLATSLAMWDEQAAALKNSYRVLRYDQRGHGATDVPAGRYAYDTLLADALGLLDALAIKKTHFAGLSMGGATALAGASITFCAASFAAAASRAVRRASFSTLSFFSRSRRSWRVRTFFPAAFPPASFSLTAPPPPNPCRKFRARGPPVRDQLAPRCRNPKLLPCRPAG